LLKRILRIAVLLFVFAGGVIVFSGLMNHDVTESASDLSDPTLPVMCIDVNGNKADRMYGYTMEMDASDLRDTLIPMTNDQELTVSYKANGSKVTSVSYEITAPDTGEVVANAKIGNFKEDGDYQTASFTLDAAILMNREYPICFTLETQGQDIRYYSRLIQRADPLTDKYIQFVYDFYETCTNKSGAANLNTYLETDETVTNTSYTSVNLKSTFDQLTWGSLNPRIIRKAVPSIKEINSQTCSIVMNYLISAEDENNRTEYYHVWEFYRLRYYNGRMMVLNFNRKALQCFDPENLPSVSTEGVVLGISTKDVPYETNQNGNIVAFVQDGALWEFNNTAQKISQVFSFHQDDESGDERYDHSDYGIRIIRVEDGGDIDFLVYGYMNRGDHEGKQGVALCHFSGEGYYVEEKAFIPFAKSNEYLEKDISRLCYVNPSGVCFLYLERAVYRIDLTARSYSEILTDIDPDCFVSASSQDKIAWMDEMKPDSSTNLTLMDLDTESRQSVTAESGTYLRTVGFINEDFVYGIANQGDLVTRAAGDTFFVMKKLVIMSIDGTVVKTYDPDNYWISGITIKTGLIELDRVTKDADGNYVSGSTDNIMNNKQASAAGVTISAKNTKRQGTVITLKMSVTVKNLSPLVSRMQIRSPGSDSVDPEVPSSDPYKLYYVYTYGALSDICTDPSQAVQEADAGVGVVLNQEGQYIYERGNTDTETELGNDEIAEAFKAQTLNAADLQSTLGGSGTVMNLTGCTLEEALYQVSEGRPVIARTADGGTVLIVGYNRYNTRLYNYDTGEHYWYGINDSKTEFANGGNVFLTYIEPDKTVKGES